MEITRHNYEEYFILYLDNELSSAERNAVEAFAAANPDLQAELDMLMQTRLIPDETIVFPAKQSLLPGNLQQIHDENYEEWFLLYMDNELSDQQKFAVEAYAATNPSRQLELDQLMRTRITADQSIVFPDKSLLYRQEERAKVVVFTWRRLAVAAALLLAVSTTALLLLKDADTTIYPSLADGPAKTPFAPAASDSNKSASVDAVQPVSPVNHVTEGSADPKLAVAPSSKKGNETSVEKGKEGNQSASEIVTAQKKIEETVATKRTNNLPAPTNNPNVNPGLPDEEASLYAKLDPPAREGLTNQKQINQLPLVTPANVQPSLIRQQLTDDADDQITYAAEPARKNKLRGFFRKVTRTFEKTTNIKATDDEDRLLIGGLAIRL